MYSRGAKLLAEARLHRPLWHDFPDPPTHLLTHRISHVLGIDVHSCSRARDEEYHLGTLRAGMTLTVEPGLYFQINDRTVPPELRGIAGHIEDELLVTPGPQNCSPPPPLGHRTSCPK